MKNKKILKHYLEKIKQVLFKKNKITPEKDFQVVSKGLQNRFSEFRYSVHFHISKNIVLMNVIKHLGCENIFLLA